MTLTWIRSNRKRQDDAALRRRPAARVAAWTAGWLLASAWAAAPLHAVEEVRASHILLRSREQAEAVREEIMENGGDREAFAAAAREHSLDVFTKKQAGDLAWFPRRGNMNAAFADAAFALEIGEVSQPVKSEAGWHLIRLKDRRDRSAGGTDSAEDGQGDDASGSVSPADPDRLVPDTDGGEATGAEAEAREVAPPQRATGNRRRLQSKRLVLTIEPAKAKTLGEDPTLFRPDRAVELDLVLKNNGRTSRQVPHPGLLPLGLEVTQHHDGSAVPGDFSELEKPESFFVELDTYDIVGHEVSVNAWFPGLVAVGRFDLEWSVEAFFRNLEARFPEATAVEGYSDIKTDLTSRRAITTDKVRRDRQPGWRRARTKPFNFSIFPQVRETDRLYARIDIAGQSKPVWVELATQKQHAAAKHFAELALQGFYDMLTFYDVAEGDYVVGGDPLMGTGTGAPAMRLPTLRNAGGIPHVRGTVSFLSRHLRKQGPVRGGEVGSIFFVSLKKHPEWNDVHVPFGEVVSGLDVIEELKPNAIMESVSILPASEYQEATGAAAGDAAVAGGNPEVKISTGKGDMEVVLYEDLAPNTVGHFLSLVEEGFFEQSGDGEPMEFFHLMTDGNGKVLIQTGSPGNDFESGKSYEIPDEVNSAKCKRGSLVMALQYDPETEAYVPNTASTQFFICLRDLPGYDYQKAFTVFGRVKGGSLPVLDRLQEGDAIEQVEVTRQGDRDLSNVRKIRD